MVQTKKALISPTPLMFKRKCIFLNLAFVIIPTLNNSLTEVINVLKNGIQAI